MAKHGGHKISRGKAKEILEHGEVRGKPLTPRQRRFMGARAGGAPVRTKRGRK